MDEPDQKYMKKGNIEYYPNGNKKYELSYYDNGCKNSEHYYDQNGKYHREDNLPDYHSWFQNGITYHKTYCIHGNYHNINNPADIYFHDNGKIRRKDYLFPNKLSWQNSIKQIKI